MAKATTAASSREEGGLTHKFYQVTDYLLGRNTLIGVASLMLLVISGFATWHGMRDFIIGVSSVARRSKRNAAATPARESCLKDSGGLV